MKEVTRVTTIEFTSVGTVKDESQIIPKDEYIERVKTVMLGLFYLDDVVVTKVQDFIRDYDQDERDSE